MVCKVVCSIWVVWTFICFIWGSWSYRVLHQLNFKNLPSDAKRKRYQPFERLDQDALTYWPIALGSIFLMPVRLLVFGTLIISYLAAYSLLRKIYSARSTASSNKLLRYLGRRAFDSYFKLGMVIAGLTFKEHDCGTAPPRLKNENSWDVLAFSEYASTTNIVSNHVSVFDIIYFLWSVSPGFLAKASINGVPLLGSTSRRLGCIFIKRNSEEDRKRVLAEVEKRQKPKANNRPFLIFAEGTTSNGTNLLPFKRGAFTSLQPIVPVVLVYECPKFNYAYDVLPFVWYLGLLFSNHCVSTLHAHWLPVVHPPLHITNDIVTEGKEQSDENGLKGTEQSDENGLKWTEQSDENGLKGTEQSAEDRKKSAIQLYQDKVRRVMLAALREKRGLVVGKCGGDCEAWFEGDWRDSYEEKCACVAMFRSLEEAKPKQT